MPASTRSAINVGTVVAKAVKNENTPKISSEATISVLRPMRSAKGARNTAPRMTPTCPAVMTMPSVAGSSFSVSRIPAAATPMICTS